MSKLRLSVHALALVVCTLAFTSMVQAQATRTWVSGVGDDVNPCSRTAPCKTFAGAISKTAAGGEIDALDPGGFGAVTITKSIVIDGTEGAGFGSILASATNGVNVNDSATATPGTIVVALRNLSINGAGTTLGLNGVNFTSGKAVSVEDCVIMNFSNAGINVNFTNASVSPQLNVRDTIIRSVTGDGIKATTTGAGQTANVSVERSSFVKNGNGLHLLTGGRAIVVGSLFTYNTASAVRFENSAECILADNTMHSNVNGISAVSGQARISNNTIVRNTGSGVALTGGTVSSFGDNKIVENGTDVSGGALGGSTKS